MQSLRAPLTHSDVDGSRGLSCVLADAPRGQGAVYTITRREAARLHQSQRSSFSLAGDASAR